MNGTSENSQKSNSEIVIGTNESKGENSEIVIGTSSRKQHPDIMLFTTKTCPNCPNAKRQLANAGIEYKLVDAEEQTALTEKYGIKSVPTLVVGNRIINGVGPIINWIKHEAEMAKIG